MEAQGGKDNEEYKSMVKDKVGEAEWKCLHVNEHWQQMKNWLWSPPASTADNRPQLGWVGKQSCIAVLWWIELWPDTCINIIGLRLPRCQLRIIEILDKIYGNTYRYFTDISDCRIDSAELQVCCIHLLWQCLHTNSTHSSLSLLSLSTTALTLHRSCMQTINPPQFCLRTTRSQLLNTSQ